MFATIPAKCETCRNLPDDNDDEDEADVCAHIRLERGQRYVSRPLQARRTAARGRVSGCMVLLARALAAVYHEDSTG